MKEELVALVKLAEIDAAARTLDLQLAEIPKQLELLRSSINTLERLLGEEKRRVVEVQLHISQSVDELTRLSDSVSKAKSKAARAGNARESEAAERELDSSRRSIKAKEEEKAKLEKVLKERREALVQHEGDFETLKSTLSEEESKAEASLKNLNQERDVVVVGRDALVAKITKVVLRRYDMIRVKQGTAVSEVRGTICSECHMSVSALLVQSLARRETLEQCPHCIRYIYTKDQILT